MRVINGLRNLKRPLRDSIVTIGVFDGVHVGHAAIIKRVAKRAKAIQSKSVVLTFDRHPLKVLHPRHNIPSLISLNHKIRLIGQLGIDCLVILDFTRAFSLLLPEEFVKNILVRKLDAREVHVSRNFYFGKGGAAGSKKLKALAKLFGFKVKIVKPVRIDRKIASSSLIRDLIVRGELSNASRFLGRPVTILGTVIRGSRLARALGYPTANINPHHEVIPPSGVYAVKVRIGNRLLNGILNIGIRPTFYSSRDLEPTIEVHIFNFHRKIYNRDIEVIFIKKLRKECKFKNRMDLVRQIKEDERIAHKILKLYKS